MTTSNCAALDAEMERAVRLFENNCEAPELGKMVGACLSRPSHKLFTRCDHAKRRYVGAALSHMTSLALASKATATFRALFTHYAKTRRAWDGADAVTTFIKLYQDERVYKYTRCDGVCAETRADAYSDDEYAAAQLSFVFDKLRGDANDVSNQNHGGAPTGSRWPR